MESGEASEQFLIVGNVDAAGEVSVYGQFPVVAGGLIDLSSIAQGKVSMAEVAATADECAARSGAAWAVARRGAAGTIRAVADGGGVSDGGQQTSDGG